jgi:transcriptional regulator with XRE-family HTH domain
MDLNRGVPSPGGKLKELRNRLGLTIRDVQERSKEIAAEHGNLEYLISHAWLTGFENGDGVPSIFKFYTLSVIYGRPVRELAGYYNVPIGEIGRDHAKFSAPRTHLLGASNLTDSETVTVPLRFRDEVALDGTNLLSKLVAIWGDIPVALVEALRPDHALYGYVGLKDFTLYPLIRPGSFVQIDVKQRKIHAGPSRTLEDRPIYFLEVRGGYACGWCEMRQDRLLVLPHPLSPSRTREFAWPREADIVGRVTALAMRIAPMAPAPPPTPGRSG